MNDKIPIRFIYFKGEKKGSGAQKGKAKRLFIDTIRAFLNRRRVFRVEDVTVGPFAGVDVIKCTRAVSGNADLEEIGEYPDSDDVMAGYLKKLLGKYDYRDAVVMADDIMSEYLGIKDILFQARKQEFLDNLTFIIGKMHTSDGKSATIVTDDMKWSVRELFAILTVVKNYYREINVVAENETINGVERIKEVMYDEWGVVLNIYSSKEQIKDRQDMILFLIREWDERIKKQLSWNYAYLVCERQPKRLRRELNTDRTYRVLYSGIAYKKDELLPYEIMVNMAWQKPLVFKNFHVSCVDIYALE